MTGHHVVAICLAVFFLFFGWRRARRAAGEKGIRSTVLRMSLFALVFLAGEVYLIFLFADLKWPKTLLWAAIVSWGLLLTAGVGSRALGAREDSKKSG